MFNKRFFFKSLSIIILINLLSYFAYRVPLFGWAFFLFILAVAAIIVWRNLFYGLLLLLGELMISSQGHLFDVYLGGFRLSLRMGVFGIILLIWLTQFLISNFKFLVKFQLPITNYQLLIKEYKFYLFFALFIIFGIVNGVMRHNNFNFLYQDVNGYLFFLLLPFFITACKNQKVSSFKFQVLSLWSAVIVWQFIIAVTLLFFYSHLDIFWRNLVPLYAWFRDQRLIEVGVYKYNFYRVFMQSGIWILMGFFVFLSMWIFSTKKEKLGNLSADRQDYEIEKLTSISLKKLISQSCLLPACWQGRADRFPNFPISFILICVITILIISLSRSFWIAGFFTFMALIIFYLSKERPKNKTLLCQLLNFIAVVIASFAIITIILLFPIGQIPGLRSLTALSDRTITTDDPAISSRWDLLPVLWQKIKPNLFLGQGFGATVTYKTSDPRYLAAHPENPYYTAFAFEWGWLDIWYKIGLLGLLTYLLLIGNILKKGWVIMSNACPMVRRVKCLPECLPDGQAGQMPARPAGGSNVSNVFATGLFFGLIALSIVHFFTPFLNHPLGIGYLLLTDAVFRAK